MGVERQKENSRGFRDSVELFQKPMNKAVKCDFPILKNKMKINIFDRKNESNEVNIFVNKLRKMFLHFRNLNSTE